MAFTPGRTIGVLMGIALISGAGIVMRDRPVQPDLLVWVFDESHARMYRQPTGGQALVERYTQQAGRSVRVELLSLRALDVRLLSMFMSPPDRPDMPDLVAVEIGSVGRYFQPPVDDIGFLPLNRYLEQAGLIDRLVPQRLSAWSKDGVIFGVPLDVHPVTITYRKDLFDEAGIDLASAGTWDEFHAMCLAYQRYWHERGEIHRRALALPRSNPGHLQLMLRQRRIELLDDDNRPRLTDPKVAQTVAFYAQLAAGPQSISAEPGAGALWTRELARGDVAAAITPDWQIADLRRHAPSLAGRLRMLPLPRFDPTDAPTSTWGGTMLGIPRHCPDPDAAWDLLNFLVFSDAGLEARRQHSAILPADRIQWLDPVWHQPDPLFGGQKIGELYVDLAEQIPPHHISPYTTLAATHLSVVLARAIDHVAEHGAANLESACANWLHEAQQELTRRIEFTQIDRSTSE